MLVEKQVHEIPELLLQNGRVLRQVRMGFETYGRLNPARDNAILVCHYFTGTSHAAGRYKESDPEPGYWNGLIGPGKAIDTDRFFVVSCDTLCNLNVKNPMVTTTGPASVNPSTGQPYGPEFPVVTIGDFVVAQNHLAEKLGIAKWYAVAGPSMGGFQSMEWAARFPEKVDRIICGIASILNVEPYVIARLNTWCSPIKLDPQFNEGKYPLEAQPLRGLTESLKLITLDALHFGVTRRQFNRRWRDGAQNPADELSNLYSIEFALENTALQRAQTADANSLLRLARAVQTFSIEDRLEKLRARFLFLPARSDLLMAPEFIERGVSELKKRGLQADVFYIEGEGGHLDGLNLIHLANEPVRRFLNS